MSHHPEPTDRQIYKRDIRHFLCDLRQQAHHIYALLAGAPKSVCRITRSDDDGEIYPYTVKEFFTALRSIHPNRDELKIRCETYFFPDECEQYDDGYDELDAISDQGKRYVTDYRRELSVANFEKLYPHILAFLCREAILDNKPFRLDRPTIRQYGFTRRDVAQLREQVERCNERIIEELRAQYDRLVAIGCLQEKQKSRRGLPPSPASTIITSWQNPPSESEPESDTGSASAH